jgi:diguanylate cyclase (GGDEF)-like protein
MPDSSTPQLPPRAETDQRETWRPSLAFVKVAIVSLLLGAGAFLLLIFLSPEPQTPRLIANLAICGLALVSWALVLRGQIRATFYSLAIGTWVLITFVGIFNGGALAPGLGAYAFIVLMAGWAISIRLAQILAGLSVAAIGGFVLADHAGVLPAPPASPATMYAIVMIATIILSAALISFLVSAFTQQLNKLRDTAVDLSRQSQALSSSQAELQRAQEVSKVGSWVYDLDADMMRLSDQTCRILNLAPGTNTSLDAYLERVHAEDRCVAATALQATSTGSSIDNTHRIVDSDITRWIRLKAEPELGVAGEVVRVVGIAQDITEHKKAQETIENLAYSDSLTQLPNRTLLRDRLYQLQTHSGRLVTWCAVLFIDLDHFKTLNDTQGHGKGDLLLQQVAKSLSGAVRQGDTVARLGGDEFVVMLNNLSSHAQEAASEAEAVCGKILSAIGQEYVLEGYKYRGTASIGVAMFQGCEASVDDLLKQADLAMYRAKATGRNGLAIFDPLMQTVASERAVLQEELGQSITAGQFELYYQAQVTHEGNITGAEALIRWQHPTRGIVSPAEFIPHAEETGQILLLGQWVLENACTQLTQWADRPHLAHLTIAVNVSPRQFQQHDFVDQVLQTLARTGAQPNRLKLELTESMLVADIDGVISKMAALRARGVVFSLDDFGTGYSSLSHLKRLPIDQLKIDGSFVRDILLDPNDAAIASMVVALSQTMGLSVIAEGVESAEQSARLATLGCHAYQGYLFGKPMPVTQFEAVLQVSSV